MSELSVADRPKQHEKTATPIKLETLGKGIGNINSEYSFSEVLSFIKSLNVGTDVWTSQSDGALEIAFPTPTLFRINRFKEFDSNIYLTGPLKKQEPEFRAQGKRQIWRPTGFVALIVLSNDKETASSKAEEVIINTELSKKQFELTTKKTISEIPNNWRINPHAKPTESNI